MKAWYAVHTRANAESKALEHLARQDYQAYLPRYRKWRCHARRREVVWRPLFPRYLFVALDLDAMRWRSVNSTPGVTQLVSHGELPSAVPMGVVETIQEQERSGLFDQVAQVRSLREGESVRIVVGPFADLIGKFIGLADQERVYVLLDLLGRKVRATVSAEALAQA